LGLDGEKDFSPETTETWSTKVEKVGYGSMEDDKSLVSKAKKMATERACKPHTHSSMSVRGGSGRHPLRIFSDSAGGLGER
jgi:hypothetical protein